MADASAYCWDPAFFAAAITTLSSRHVFEPALWKWAVKHMHGPALKQLLPSTQLVQQLQRTGVPVAALLDNVFGTSSCSDNSASGVCSSSRGGGGGDDVASSSSGDTSKSATDDAVLGCRHLEYWPWVNPYCRPILTGGCGVCMALGQHP